MSGDQSPRFFLHFEGPLAKSHKVPAGVLVQALTSLQRSVFLLAMALEGYEVGQRARVSQAIDRRYGLLCDLSEEGGFVQPYQIGDPTYALFDADLVSKLTCRHEEVLRAVDKGDPDALRAAVPDTYYRNNIINALWKMQPPERSGLVLHVEVAGQTRLLDGQDAVRNLRSLAAARRAPLVSPGVVTGELTELKFQERQLRLQIVPGGKTLVATYVDDFEPVLLENPRQLVQLKGNIVFGEDGETPHSITEVDEIVQVDTSPIVLERLTLGGTAYRSARLLQFRVDFNSDAGHFECDGPFGIFTAAPTRARLEDAVDDEMRLLWAEYARAPDEDLASSGIELKRELNSAFEEE